MTKRTFPIFFHKGLNTTNAAHLLEDGECQIAQDCDFDKEGNVYSRKFKVVETAYTGTIGLIYPFNDIIVNEGNNVYDGATLIGTTQWTNKGYSLEYNNIWFGMTSGTYKKRYGSSWVQYFNDRIWEANSNIAWDGSQWDSSGNDPAIHDIGTWAGDSVDSNLCVGGTPSSGAGTSANAFDGSITTSWLVTDGQSWIQYYKATGITANNCRAYGVWNTGGDSYTLRGSDNGSDWSDVLCTLNLDSGSSSWQEYSLTKCTYKYWRWTSVGAGSSKNQIYELELEISDGASQHLFRPTAVRITFSGNDTLHIYVYDTNGDTIGEDATYTSLDEIALTFGNYAIDKISFVDGDSDLLITNIEFGGGSGFTDMGVSSPLAAPTLAESGTGLTGTYYYKYTYIDENGKESQASTVSDAIEVENKGVAVTVVASTQKKVVYIKIYRLVDTIYYSCADYILANKDAAYVDTEADEDLTLAYHDNTHYVPPDAHYLFEHYERLLALRTATYPNGIWFSEEYEPEYFGSTSTGNQYLLGNNDPFTGGISWGRYVVAWKKNEIYVLEGTNPENWHRRRSNAQIGNISPYAITFWRLPIFCHYTGLYNFDGEKEQKLSDKVNAWFSTNVASLPDAVACIYDNKLFFSISTATLILDLLNDRFYTWNFGLGAIAYDADDNSLYGGYSKYLVKLDQSTNTDSESVSFDIKSKKFALNKVEGLYGDLRKYELFINTESNDVSFLVYLDGSLAQTITLNTSSMQRVLGSFQPLKGKYVEFRFTYSGTDRIEIQCPIMINPDENPEDN